MNKKLKDRTVYTGELDSNDLPEGHGLQLFMDGAFIHGQFRCGKPDQKGLKVFKSGKLMYGVWNQGKTADFFKVVKEMETPTRATGLKKARIGSRNTRK